MYAIVETTVVGVGESKCILGTLASEEVAFRLTVELTKRSEEDYRAGASKYRREYEVIPFYGVSAGQFGMLPIMQPTVRG